MGMTGLETLAEREAKFHELRQDWRQQLHKLQGTVYQYKLSELERGMDVLVQQSAELAREPLLRHLLALAATKPLTPVPAASMVELGRETQAREWDAYAAKQAEAYFDEREKRLAAEAALAKAESALAQLKAVLCDPEGRCCIAGSDEDRAIVDRALAALSSSTTPKEPNNG